MPTSNSCAFECGGPFCRLELVPNGTLFASHSGVAPQLQVVCGGAFCVTPSAADSVDVQTRGGEFQPSAPGSVEVQVCSDEDESAAAEPPSYTPVGGAGLQYPC